MKKCLLLLVVILALLPAVGCHRVAGNQPRFYYADDVNAWGIFDFENKKYRGDVDEISESLAVAVEGGTAPRYCIEAPDCEGIVDDIEALALDTERSVVYAYGIEKDGYVYGICNVYADTIGYLSGGGNYGVEEIACGVYFRYDRSADEFSILSILEDACLVAFGENGLLLWKDKAYYYFAFADGEYNFLVRDLAYDEGLQHQSRARITFDGAKAILHLVKAQGSAEYDYVFCFDFEKESFFQMYP